jgi:hypothetical protein
MSNVRSARSFMRTTVLGCAVALAAFICALPASAQDDEQTFEQSILRGLLGGGSSRPDLDYRERSPLVIPPSRDLPPPDSGASLRTRAWPNDPDAQRRRQASSTTSPAIDAIDAAGRHLSPNELRRGTVSGRSRPTGPAPTLSDNEMGRPLRPSELGENKTLFGLIGIGGTAPQKAEAFTSEPARTRLTEPPSGYRTPSGGQPYAAPKDSGAWYKPFSWFDRASGEYK